MTLVFILMSSSCGYAVAMPCCLRLRGRGGLHAPKALPASSADGAAAVAWGGDGQQHLHGFEGGMFSIDMVVRDYELDQFG